MKNYLSVLRNRASANWGGFHSDGPWSFRMRGHATFHFCPVQTGNITNSVETIDIFYNLAECTKSEFDEAKALIESMIQTVSAEYCKVAQITEMPVLESIKAIYTGHDTSRFTIRVTTPVMKDGRYLIDDILGRYHGNVPENPSTPVAIYKIKPVKAA